MSTSRPATHRATHRAARGPWHRSVRLRAALGLGVLGVTLVGGTFALWTDSVVVDGGSFTGGTLDLKVNNGDSAATTTLAMSAMVPGSTSAEVLTVRNGGTASLKYAVTAGLTGTDAAAFSAAGSLRISVLKDGTRSGSGSSATCTGGTALATLTTLTTATSATVVANRGPVVPAGTESLCVQVTLDAAAPATLQGRTTSLTLTATGTSDLS